MIWNSPKEGNGAEPLPEQSYRKLPEAFKDNPQKFLVFRFSRKGRIIGFHENETFHVVAFDPKHYFCN